MYKGFPNFHRIESRGKWTLWKEILQLSPFFSLRTSGWKLWLKKGILKCIKGELIQLISTKIQSQHKKTLKVHYFNLKKET